MKSNSEFSRFFESLEQ